MSGHEHGHGLRCMECVTLDEFQDVPDDLSAGLAERTNWEPPEMIIFFVSPLPGYCRSCGSYRIDGEPPYLHVQGCPRTPEPGEEVERFLRSLTERPNE